MNILENNSSKNEENFFCRNRRLLLADKTAKLSIAHFILYLRFNNNNNNNNNNNAPIFHSVKLESRLNT